MPSHYLSERTLANLRCPQGQQHLEVFDAAMKGLYVDVQRTGRMRYRVRYQFAGKSRVITLGDARVITLDEARSAARDVLRKVREEIDPTSADELRQEMSVESFFLNQYLPFVKSYKRSWATDESIIRNHIVPKLGMTAMSEVSQGEIAGAINQMREANYAVSTCNRFLVLVRYGFKLAMRWGMLGIVRNPALDLVERNVENRVERYLSVQQSKALFDSVRQSPNQMLQYIVAFLVFTGARKREVLDALWSNIDFERRSWRIPKTKSGKIRHLPLSTEALGVLAKVKTLAGYGGPFIFPNLETRKPFVNIFMAWDSARKRAGLPELRIHDLRHSFASFLVNAGRSLYEVQQLLGHADIRTTSRYAHLSRDRLLDAVESLPVKLDALDV